MGQSHRFIGLESAPVNLLEILYIDSGILVMELKKRLITYMMVQERHPPAVAYI